MCVTLLTLSGPSDRNVDAAGMNEEELALKMSKIRALKVANILHLNVKKVSRIEKKKKNKQTNLRATNIVMAILYHPHTTTFIHSININAYLCWQSVEAHTKAEQAVQKNAHEIMQLYLHTVLNEFHSELHRVGSQQQQIELTLKERTSVLLMCDWILLNAAQVIAPLLHLALAIYKILSTVAPIPSPLLSVPTTPTTPSSPSGRSAALTSRRKSRRTPVSTATDHHAAAAEKKASYVAEPVEPEDERIHTLEQLIDEKQKKGQLTERVASIDHMPTREKCPLCNLRILSDPFSSVGTFHLFFFFLNNNNSCRLYLSMEGNVPWRPQYWFLRTPLFFPHFSSVSTLF